MNLKCAIIDDEPLARECISNYVKEIDFLESVGVGSNPIELTQLLNQHKVELIFLDIQMPIMSGIDFLKISPNLPMVIITTAYPSYALEGFQLDVLDYLIKPITFSRFFKAVTKAKDYHELIIKSETPQLTKSNPKYFFIKCDHRYEKILFEDLLYIEAMQNYVTLFTRNGKYITLLPLKNVEQNLDAAHFVRVHKSYIVSTSKIDAIEDNTIIIQSFRIPISRSYYDEVVGKIMKGKLWRKNDGKENI
ncbi:MAG: LytR/AlgR family response regulator transcription factor [Cyclobacteriaceae bacterium]